ncbi:methyltransferase domain-containing protein [Kitasatospora sp. NPDC059648]|uniref:methyltransferase domain-containing protein n=1 Tax=Kitasatospora sp. NPDC059648 TaxID=3346894 RepID=UPI0036BBAE6D
MTRTAPRSQVAVSYIESFGQVDPLVLPGATACYECFRNVGELEQYLAPGEQPGPDLNPGFQAGSYGPLKTIVASMAANEVLRCLLGADCRSAGTRLMLDSRSYRLHNEHFPRHGDCPSCGSVIADPRWSTAVQQVKLEDIYDAGRADASFFVLDGLMEKISRSAAEHGPGWKALDYGCGTGEQTRALADHGADVVAFDRSERMLELLRDKLPTRLAPQVTTVAGTSLGSRG